jgi:nucleotide-binding universal stress UspA family protein
MSFKKILVATDLSDASDEALRRGVRLAKALGAKLAVAHAIPNMVGAEPVFTQDATDMANLLPALHRRLMNEAVARALKAGAIEGSFEVHVIDGGPVDAIKGFAKTWGADLLVVAATGKSGLARLLLGSVSTRLLREVPISVLVARQHGALTKRLFVATDFSDGSDAAFEVGAQIAGKSGFFTTLCHVVDAPNFPEMGSVPIEVKNKVFDEVENELQQMMKDSGLDGDWLAEEGETSAALLSAIAKVDPEIAVLATSGRTGLVYGSVAQKIAERSTSSVLVVRLVEDA